MTKLKVKVENFPLRCDICHQSDQFDQKSGYCGRCQHSALSGNKAEQQLKQKAHTQKVQGNQRENIVILAIMVMSSILGGLIAVILFRGLPEIIIMGILLPLFIGGLIKYLLWTNRWSVNNQ